MSEGNRGKRVADVARRGGERAKEGAHRGYKRGRRGFVIFITSDKILQAVLTGAVTSVVFSLNEGVAAYFQRWLSGAVPVFVPVKIYAALGAMVVVVIAYHADRHTEGWREYVREATGEQTAEDTASEQDVAGDGKN